MVCVRSVVFGSLLFSLVGFPAAAQPARISSSPDSAQLITTDILRFWEVFDRATTETLGELLQRDYMDAGTPGLQDFIPDRILSAAALAETINLRRERYEEIREASFDVHSAERSIRASFYALKYLYPDAVFPDVQPTRGKRFATSLQLRISKRFSPEAGISRSGHWRCRYAAVPNCRLAEDAQLLQVISE